MAPKKGNVDCVKLITPYNVSTQLLLDRNIVRDVGETLGGAQQSALRGEGLLHLHDQVRNGEHLSGGAKGSRPAQFQMAGEKPNGGIPIKKTLTHLCYKLSFRQNGTPTMRSDVKWTEKIMSIDYS